MPILKVNLAIGTVSRQILLAFPLPNFHRNDGNVTGDKNVISAYLENVDQGTFFQKVLYLGYY